MERLTKRFDRGDGVIETLHFGHRYGKAFFPTEGGYDEYVMMLERLAAYEDTGLEPEEVVALKHSAEITRKECQPLLRAESEGRLAILPKIKRGKTLYWIWGDQVMPVRYWGISGGCMDDGKYHVTCEMRTKKDRTFISNYRGKSYPRTFPAGEKRYFYADRIGKDVFFTKKEAENALKHAEKEET